MVARATQKPRNRSCLPGNTGEKQWLHPVISEFSTSPQNPKTDIAENKNASDLVELLVKLQVPSRDSCGGVEDPRVPPSTTRVMKKFEKKFFLIGGSGFTFAFLEKLEKVYQRLSVQ